MTDPVPTLQVQEVDSREAQKAGLLRPLVRKEIESHFTDFGLEPEFTTHNTMRGLSGGQKVKVVLAAATWRRPHIVILDEPTNYVRVTVYVLRLVDDTTTCRSRAVVVVVPLGPDDPADLLLLAARPRVACRAHFCPEIV